MVSFAFGGLGIVAAILFGYAALCNWLFRLVMRPLAVPAAMVKEFKRERMMTFIIFFSLPLSWLGGLLLLGTYGIGIYRHFHERRGLVAGSAAAPGLPRVPRIALSELLVMLFSLASFPLILFAIIGAIQWILTSKTMHESDEVRAAESLVAFILGALIFPMCFASAYHRLDGNRVRLGRARMMFLFFYPYMMVSMLVLAASPLTILVFAFVRMFSSENLGGLILAMVPIFLPPLLLLGVGRLLAAKAALDINPVVSFDGGAPAYRENLE